MIYIIVILVIALICYIIYRKKVKKLRLDNLTLITGGVKTGKTALAVKLALKDYRKRLIKYKVRVFFQKLFKKKLDEKPLIYSNIPLNCEYSPITLDIALRRKRINYGSVVLISESALFASSIDIKDKDINQELTLFYKLFGHESHGGSLYIETQDLNDNHYSARRSMSRYLWIQTSIKLPFFVLCKVREMAYQDCLGAVSNVFSDDVDETTRWIIYSKKIWKKYDRFTYSTLTDDLPRSNLVIDGSTRKNLKSYSIVSLPFKSDYSQSLDLGIIDTTRWYFDD